MNTFIRVAELWVPDADGYLLEFGGGLYGHAPEFGAISRKMCFGRGEGLPGRVWEERRPVIVKDLQGGFFQRAAAAKAAGLACAVAFPVFFGQVLKAVVVLFCGSPEASSGAVEVWGSDGNAASSAGLRLLDGVYGATEAAFEAASRGLLLRPGAGLPGQAWERAGSVFVDGLVQAAGFARAGAVATTRLQRGLAIPCPVPGAQPFVLCFLSAPTTPIASCIESWVAGSGARSLQLAYGFDEELGALSAGEAAPEDVGSAIVQAFAGGVPVLQAASTGAATRPLIAFPVVRDGAVVEAVAMYL